MNYPQIILKQEREISIARRHHWIFSGGIERLKGKIEDGCLVEVVSKKGNYLATGYYSEGTSIAVKILSFNKTEINSEFWQERISSAFSLRQCLNLTNQQQTNCYRLINAEGDLCPGLIIDIYNDLAVIQCQTLGIRNCLENISTGLKFALPHLKSIFHSADNESSYLLGDVTEPYQAKENGLNFIIDHERGQKTGFFIDQRENRALVEKLSKDKIVLNAFCYTGGFSIYALRAGAKKVFSLDSSKQALGILEKNILLNFTEAKHETIAQDFFEYINKTKEEFDLIVLDPPAFAKSHKVLPNAIKGYRNINAQSMEKIKRGGLLFTFSCSQAISKELFPKKQFLKQECKPKEN